MTRTSKDVAAEIVRSWMTGPDSGTWPVLEERIAAAIEEAVGVELEEMAAELALAKLGTEENYGSGRVTHYYRCDVSSWIRVRGKVG